MRDTSGTDHVSFDAVGLPGFQFIQDEIEYETRTHHTNMDVYERLQRADLMQASVVMAVFVWQAANARRTASAQAAAAVANRKKEKAGRKRRRNSPEAERGNSGENRRHP